MSRSASVALLATVIVLAVLALPGNLDVANGLAVVTISGVQPNGSSVRLFYNPVPGAKDYRVYDMANPSDVKYAGQAHYVPGDNCPGSFCLHHFASNPDGSVRFPYQVVDDSTVQSGPNTVQDVAATDIEWNGLNDSNPHTLVVEGLDMLGPVPQQNLYTGAETVKSPLAPNGMLGSNRGRTGDGDISANGQGPYTNRPSVIARSQQVVVQAQPNVKPIGSGTQQFLDTFENTEASGFSKFSGSLCGNDQYGGLGGNGFYTLGAGTAKEWRLDYREADVTNSMPFISNGHFMDMLFAGMTPGCSGPADTIYGSMAMSPKATADMTDGGVLHLTMEVDAHQSFRRWLAFDLSPADDPLQSWEHKNHQINASNRGLFVEVKVHEGSLDIYNGGSGVPTATYSAFIGSPELYLPNDLMESGRALDDRSKLDLFVSQTQLMLYEDDKLVYQTAIPAGAMPWFSGPLKAYYTHYLYHSTADVSDLKNFQFSGQGLCYPLNSYWFNDPVNGTAAGDTNCNTAYPPGYGLQYSDERHWDNMGFEVLSDFSQAAAIAQLPAIQQPQLAGSAPPTTTPSPTPTQTTVPTATPTSTATLTPTATATFTATPTSTPQPTDTPPATATATMTSIPTVTPTQTATVLAATSTATGTAAVTVQGTVQATRTPTVTPTAGGGVIGSGGGTNTPTATLTVTTTPQPTREVTPTRRPTRTPTPTTTVATCQVLAVVNGQTKAFSRPSSFCTDQ